MYMCGVTRPPTCFLLLPSRGSHLRTDFNAAGRAIAHVFTSHGHMCTRPLQNMNVSTNSDSNLCDAHSCIPYAAVCRRSSQHFKVTIWTIIQYHTNTLSNTCYTLFSSCSTLKYEITLRGDFDPRNHPPKKKKTMQDTRPTL